MQFIAPLAVVATLLSPHFAPSQEAGKDAAEDAGATVTVEIDLKDYPKILRGYAEAAVGLQEPEFSTTLDMALSIGQAADRKRVPKDMKESAMHSRDLWNKTLTQVLAPATGQPGGTILAGAVFHEPALLGVAEVDQVEILLEPEFLLVPMADGIDEILKRRSLIYGMRKGLSKADAAALEAMIERALRADPDALSNTWVGHAQMHLMYMGVGGFGDYVEEMRDHGTPDGPWEEFQQQVMDETAQFLIGPLRPSLDEAAMEGRYFHFEGEYVVQVVDTPPAGKGAPWEAPAAVIAANAADRAATLLIQVPAQTAITGDFELARVVIGMVAGGEFRPIFDGSLPFR